MTNLSCLTSRSKRLHNNKNRRFFGASSSQPRPRKDMVRTPFCTSSKCTSDALVNEYTFRSHNCGQLRSSDEGKTVTVCGWVQFQRMGKFITLRDSYGVIQLIVPDSPNCNLDPQEYAKLPLESVIVAKGMVKRRPDDQINKKMATGEVEIELSDLRVIGQCKTKLPYHIRDFQKVNENLRLKYRYLDLRNTELQTNLRLRSQFVMRLREYFNKFSFIEVETPTLFKKTPGVSSLLLMISLALLMTLLIVKLM